MPAEILVVEDNEQNLELAAFLLEEAGYGVRRATSAAEARRELRREGIGLVLMDMNLGGGEEGLRLIAEMRADGRLGRVPVVALTAHAMRGDRERFLAGGCDGYVSKPIDVKSFAGEVAAYLARGRAGGGRER